ncbi:hypothetical protein PSECIP111951_03052 [Pseudoalteromonas holothuriae]|uniref:Uncharacterized protein n=1 Tax=Pseudoalteromonas holothuriae TaxID=2963714 RepID=A0A9W4W4S8_9GAMM|nr:MULTISPECIES: hypothetical protein [unclassified Pseudoalteromonas]CAH9059736.1 hypothetical protein PSECIP111854_02466 [Pseudoalteromonas sp. CIP111854]CAH9064119.1 hypothetical protein PSECIP111951_03052 [Pseudoalteromonas sp. CIP111951]
MQKALIFSSFLCLNVTGCDVFESSKSQIEAQYLSQHQELKTAIETIREHGLDNISATAKSGSVAACVATQLEGDPMGALIAVEGALQDSVSLENFASTIESLSEQEISLESIPQLLRQGADTVNYLRTLLSNYELSELQQQSKQLMQDSYNKSQSIGEHLRMLIEQCETTKQ